MAVSECQGQLHRHEHKAAAHLELQPSSAHFLCRFTVLLQAPSGTAIHGETHAGARASRVVLIQVFRLQCMFSHNACAIFTQQLNFHSACSMRHLLESRMQEMSDRTGKIS